MGITIETLNSIYISIIRLVLEYSSLCNVTVTNFNKLLAIKSKVIKIINHKPMFASVRDIGTDIQALNERFDEINKKIHNPRVTK